MGDPEVYAIYWLLEASILFYFLVTLANIWVENPLKRSLTTLFIGTL